MFGGFSSEPIENTINQIPKDIPEKINKVVDDQLQQVEKLIPNVNKKGLRGGVIYHDGQFDDSRMAITLALSADSKKTTLLNYCNVEGLIKKDGEIMGLN